MTMTNGLCMLLYAPQILCNLVLLVSIAADRKKGTAHFSYFIFSIMLLVWQLCEFMCFAVPNVAVIRFLYDFKLPFVAMATLSILILVVDYYRYQKTLRRPFLYVLYGVPVVTLLLALFSSHHTLIRDTWAAPVLAPLIRYETTRGPWFYVHMLYCYVVFLLIAWVVVTANRRLPSAYKNGVQFLHSALALIAVALVAEAVPLHSTPLDMNLLATGLGGAMFYVAVFSSGSASYQHIKRREIFHYIDEAVFILDNDDRFVEGNTPAMQLFSLLGLSPGGLEGCVLDEVLMPMTTQNRVQMRREDLSRDTDFVVMGQQYPIIYSAQSHPYYLADGTPGGRYVILSDVTNARLYHERLQQAEGVDTLTGLPNQYSCQETLRRLDCEDNLPLSAVTLAVDSLKYVNELFGYYEGDLLLTSIADVLSECCPRGGFAARVGGNEFMLLLPRHSHSETLALISRLRRELALLSSPAMNPSVVLVHATKTRAGGNINALLLEARS